MTAAVKSDDGFFATFLVSSYSPYLVRSAARLRLRPNQVTMASLVVALAAAAGFALGSRAALITGAVLLQVSFTLDVVDGQLARYTGTTSAFGGWLDLVADRSKEYVCYAGLAIGSAHAFHDDVWALAGAALVLQTCRHMLDLAFTASRSGDLAQSEPAGRAARLGRGAIDLSERTNRGGPGYWAKRIVVLPVGERLLLISVTAAGFRPQVTFVALLVWGSVALIYGATGRILRSFAAVSFAGAADPLLAYRDDGPLATLRPVALRPAVLGRMPALGLALIGVVPWFVVLALTRRGGALLAAGVALAWLVCWGVASGRAGPAGRLDWLVPPLVQAAEYVGVLRLAAIATDHDVAAGYTLAAVLVLRHYDLVYRPVTSRWSRRVGLLAGGWALRLVVAVVLAAAGIVRPGYYTLAAVLAALLVGDAAWAWHDPRSRQDAPATHAAEEIH